MKIKDIRIQNYKSWSDSKQLKICDDLNVIVGQNNVGKTALLDTIQVRPPCKIRLKSLIKTAAILQMKPQRC